MIAQLFAAEGAAIAVHGRDQRAIDIVRERIEATGVKVIGVRAELTDFAEVERMRVQVEEALGPVDLLVACAGANLVMPGLLEETPIDAWRATVDTNLTATFLTLKSLLPGMKDRRRGDIAERAPDLGAVTEVLRLLADIRRRNALLQ